MINALVLFDVRHASQNRPAILDHVQCLSHAPTRVRAAYVNLTDDRTFDPRWLQFDLVVLHGTLLDRRTDAAWSVAAKELEWLERYEGMVVAMPNAEFDHAHVLDTVLANARTHIVVTSYDATSRALLYPHLHTRAYFVEALPAYLNPMRVEQARTAYRVRSKREIDVMYRARELPFAYGRLGQQRSRMVAALTQPLRAAGRSIDLSLKAQDAVLGDSWLDFLGRARVVLGTERGSSVIDRRGEIGSHVRALLGDDPTLTFDAVDAAMEGELSRYQLTSIAPRHLEAVTTRTVQLLVDGHYSGVLEAWKHYIPLRADFSNIAEVMDALADERRLDEMAEHAYADIVASGRYSYTTFATQLLDVVELFRSLRAQS